MPGPASAVATAITVLAEGVEQVIAWAKKKKAEDQAAGQKIVDQMKSDTAEIERRAREAARKP